jgi:hypothetical protein
MKSHELTELLGRLKKAKQHGHAIANAEAYVSSLEQITGPLAVPAGSAKNSAGHLIALAERALQVQAGEAQAVVPPSPAPRAVVTPSEPEPDDTPPASTKESKPKSKKRKKDTN